MTVFSARRFPILFHNRWTTTGLAGAIDGIDMDALGREYDELRAAAPSRAGRGKPYFVGHDGCPRAKDPANPSEKHLAIALWRLGTLRTRTDVSRIRLLDYQVPLKAARSDTGLGEVDLLGATAEGRIAIVELKVGRRDGSRGETPVHALMEGLRYAAVVRANIGAIAAEADDLFGIDVPDRPPIVQILAPADWWRGWRDMVPRTRRAAGPWEARFLELATRVEARLGIAVECASLEATGLADIDWNARRPLLPRPPTVSGVALDQVPATGPVVDYAGYERALRGRFWAWADRHHPDELDGGVRDGRPPVLHPDAASRAVLCRPTPRGRATSWPPFPGANGTGGSAA